MTARKKPSRTRSHVPGAAWKALPPDQYRASIHQLLLNRATEPLVEVLVYPTKHNEFDSRFLVFLPGKGFLRVWHLSSLKKAKEYAEHAVLHGRRFPDDRFFGASSLRKERQAVCLGTPAPWQRTSP